MFATIYLPNFYLQAAMRHQPELRTQPVALIEEQENKPVIIQLNHAAESAGVRKGMTPSQALARCLRVVIKTRERAREKSINEILIQHAFTLAQAGIAHLPDASYLAAHLAQPVLRIDDAKKFLGPLPIETLAIGI